MENDGEIFNNGQREDIDTANIETGTNIDGSGTDAGDTRNTDNPTKKYLRWCTWWRPSERFTQLCWTGEIKNTSRGENCGRISASYRLWYVQFILPSFSIRLIFVVKTTMHNLKNHG